MTTYRLGVSGLIGVGLGLTLFFSYRILYADIKLWHAKALVTHESFESAERLVNEARLKIFLREAAEYNPWDAVVASESANVLSRLFGKLSVIDPELAREILQHRQKAIILQPLNASHWAAFAQSKSLNGEYDQDFYRAYRHAYQQGRHESLVDAALVELGLMRWYMLEPGADFPFKDAVRTLYLYEKNRVLYLGKNYGQLFLICDWIQDLSDPDPMCLMEARRQEYLQRLR